MGCCVCTVFGWELWVTVETESDWLLLCEWIGTVIKAKLQGWWDKKVKEQCCTFTNILSDSAAPNRHFQKEAEWERFFFSFLSASDILLLGSFIELTEKWMSFHLRQYSHYSAYLKESGFSLQVKPLKTVNKTKQRKQCKYRLKMNREKREYMRLN